MREQFETTLTGSDSPIDGIVTPITQNGSGEAYEFKSLDDSLHLIIAKDDNGKWKRVDGTVPYLSGWTDELVKQIVVLQK
jgi:hypothetical protein